MNLPRTQWLHSKVTSPVLHLPVTSTVIDLDGARVLHSPGSKLTEEQLRSAGAVTDIVAPSLTHTAGMAAASKVFPKARTWGPAGVREAKPDLKWDGIFGVDPWPYESQLQAIVLPAVPQLSEVEFFHPASKTLYLNDFVFNIRDPKGLLAWMFFGMFGTYKRFAVSKLFLRYVKDRAAFERAVAGIAALPFENVVPGHGEPVLGDAKERLLAAFRERKLLA